MKNYFLSTPECVKSFYDTRTETELYVKLLGYHNFRFVKPYPYFRTQNLYTMHLVLSGKGTLEINQKIYHLKQGDIFVLPPNILFSYFPDKNEPWEYIFFDFWGTMVEEYLQSASFSINSPIKTCHSFNKIVLALSEYFERHKNNIAISYFETASLFFSVLHSTLEEQDACLQSEQIDLIEEAKLAIQTKFYNADLTVQSIANDLHVSHSMLCKKFKESMGITMIAYINHCRMEYAEQLLKTTSLKAVEVAYMSGFREYTYFLLQFKRKHNMTTGEYRTLSKNNPS